VKNTSNINNDSEIIIPQVTIPTTAPKATTPTTTSKAALTTGPKATTQ